MYNNAFLTLKFALDSGQIASKIAQPVMLFHCCKHVADKKTMFLEQLSHNQISKSFFFRCISPLLFFSHFYNLP
ncbi:MAG: hypothetical protein ACQPRI_06490, partial [Solitalea-like symbiont of Tyrophagus putrescentiae]